MNGGRDYLSLIDIYWYLLSNILYIATIPLEIITIKTPWMVWSIVFILDEHVVSCLMNLVWSPEMITWNDLFHHLDGDMNVPSWWTYQKWSGWWLTYPSEKIWKSDWIIIPSIGEIVSSHVPNHQALIVWCLNGTRVDEHHQTPRRVTVDTQVPQGKH